MKKVFLTIILFLIVSFASNVNAQQLKRHVVGSGGFVAKQTSIGKVSGIWGQTAIGLKTEGNAKYYLGFWAPQKSQVGIEDEINTGSGIYNFPNPVVGSTSFKFNLNETATVTINVYNNLGIKIATVCNDNLLDAGLNSVQWDIRNAGVEISAGAYLYEMLATPVSNSSKIHSLRGMLIISK